MLHAKHIWWDSLLSGYIEGRQTAAECTLRLLKWLKKFGLKWSLWLQAPPWLTVIHPTSRGRWRLQRKSTQFSDNCVVVLTNSRSGCLQGALKRPPPLPLLSFCVLFLPISLLTWALSTASPISLPLTTFFTILCWFISKLLKNRSGKKIQNTK